MNRIRYGYHRLCFRLRYYQLRHYPLSYYIARLAKIPRVVCKDRVVVTFTTIPERIAHIALMVKSILDQTVLPDKIYLALPEIARRTQTPYSIPTWLLKIPLLEIIKTPHDFGPSTKLIPAWIKEREGADTRIITIDDDYIYARHLIASLVSWSEKLPASALGLSGVIVPTNFLPSQIVTQPLPYLRNLTINSANISAPTRVDYFFGFTAILVRAKFFQDSLLDYSNAPEAAFFEDDLWIGGHLARGQVDRFIIPTLDKRIMPKACHKTAATSALSKKENQNGKNMDIVYQYLFPQPQGK